MLKNKSLHIILFIVLINNLSFAQSTFRWFPDLISGDNRWNNVTNWIEVAEDGAVTNPATRWPGMDGNINDRVRVVRSAPSLIIMETDIEIQWFHVNGNAIIALEGNTLTLNSTEEDDAGDPSIRINNNGSTLTVSDQGSGTGVGTIVFNNAFVERRGDFNLGANSSDGINVQQSINSVIELEDRTTLKVRTENSGIANIGNIIQKTSVETEFIGDGDVNINSLAFIGSYTSVLLDIDNPNYNFTSVQNWSVPIDCSLNTNIISSNETAIQSKIKFPTSAPSVASGQQLMLLDLLVTDGELNIQNASDFNVTAQSPGVVSGTPYSGTDMISINEDFWFYPETWNTGCVPTLKDNVTVDHNVSIGFGGVSFNAPDAYVRNLTVNENKKLVSSFRGGADGDNLFVFKDFKVYDDALYMPRGVNGGNRRGNFFDQLAEEQTKNHTKYLHYRLRGNVVFRGNENSVIENLSNPNDTVRFYGPVFFNRAANLNPSLESNIKSPIWLRTEPEQFNGNFYSDITFKSGTGDIIFDPGVELIINNDLILEDNVGFDMSNNTLTFARTFLNDTILGSPSKYLSEISLGQSLTVANLSLKKFDTEDDNLVRFTSPINTDFEILIQDRMDINDSRIQTVTNRTNDGSKLVFDIGSSYTRTGGGVIDGPVDKIGNEDFVFPVGDYQQSAVYFAPMGMSAPSTTTSRYQANYDYRTPIGVQNLSADITNICDKEYWTFEQIIGTETPADLSLTLNWDVEGRTCSETINQSVGVGGRDNDSAGNGWVEQDTSNRNIIGDFFSEGSITTQGLTTFGEFTFISSDIVAPGGVSRALNFWLRADFKVDGTAPITDWKHFQNGFFASAEIIGDPELEENIFNYNPAVKFDSIDVNQFGLNDKDYIESAFRSELGDSISFFYVMMPRDSVNQGTVLNHRRDIYSRVNQSELFSDQLETVTPHSLGSNSSYSIPTLRTAYYDRGGSGKIGINNFFEDANIGSTEGLDDLIIVGADEGVIDPFDGKIAEVIVYNQNTGENPTTFGNETQRIQSYLALKYGITLDQSSSNANDYVASDAVTNVWVNDGDGYEHDIFGIGKDVFTDLDQRVSKSVNDTAVLTISLDPDFTSPNKDASRTTEIAEDLQFLTIANDGKGLEEELDEIEDFMASRLSREWKVDNTNFGQTVNMKFDGFDDTYELAIDDDGDFSAGVTSLGNLSASGEINNITLEDGKYFTLFIRGFNIKLVEEETTSPTGCGLTDGQITITSEVLPDGPHEIFYTDEAGDPQSFGVFTFVNDKTVIPSLPDAIYSDIYIVWAGQESNRLQVTLEDPNPILTIDFDNSVTDIVDCSGGAGGTIAFDVTNISDDIYDVEYQDISGNDLQFTNVTVTAGSGVISNVPSGVYNNLKILKTDCTPPDGANIQINPAQAASLVFAPNPPEVLCTDETITLEVTSPISDDLQYAFAEEGDLGGVFANLQPSPVFVIDVTSIDDVTSYELTYFDFVGSCGSSNSGGFLFQFAPDPEITLSDKTSSNCTNDSGTATFSIDNISDGVYNLNYVDSDSNSQSVNIQVTNGSFTLTELAPGNYTGIQLTTTNCNSNSLDIEIEQLVTPELQVVETNPTACGAEDGILTFTTTNLSDDLYNIVYDDGVFGNVSFVGGEAVIDTLGAGNYDNFYISVLGCQTPLISAVLQDPETPVLQVLDSVPPSSCSASDGQINLSLSYASGDSFVDGSYEFDHDGGFFGTFQVTSGLVSLTGLPAGDYNNIRVNVNNCPSSIEVELDEVGKFDVTLESQSVDVVVSNTIDPSCGQENGLIEFTLQNGTYDLRYDGPTGSQTLNDISVTTETFLLDNLAGGTYDNIIFSSNGCDSSPLTQTIAASNQPLITNVDIPTPTSCPQTVNIDITFDNVPEGTHPISYSFIPSIISVDANGKGTLVIFGLASDFILENLQITVNGCSSPLGEDYLIPAFDTSVINIISQSPSSCGANSGTIEIEIPQGNYDSYSLEFSTDNSFSSSTIIEVNNGFSVGTDERFTISDLASGFYRNISVVNLSSCNFSETTPQVIEIQDDSATSITTVVNNPSCGAEDGSIEFTLDNGTYDLSYDGPNGSQTVNSISVTTGSYLLEDLAGGNYDNIVFSSNGCNSSPVSEILTSTNQPLITNIEVGQPTVCPGEAVVQITFENVPEGTHDVFTFNDPNALTTMTVNSSGIGSIDFLTFFDSEEIEDFQIEVNGCKSPLGTNFTITKFQTPIIEIESIANSSSCSPNSGSISLDIPTGDYRSYSLEYSIDNTFASTITISDNTNFTVGADQIFTINNLAAGFYRNINFENSSRCTLLETNPQIIEIEENPLPTINAVANDPTICAGNGSIDFTFTNVPDSDYTITYDGGQFNDVTVTAGSASVIVTDIISNLTYNNLQIEVDGCTSQNGINIVLQPNNQDISLSSTGANRVLTPRPACVNDSTGTIRYDNLPNLDFVFVTYRFNSNTANEVVIPLNPGDIQNGTHILSGLLGGFYYDYGFITSSGCRYIEFSTLNNSAIGIPPVVSISNSSNPSCGTDDGSIQFTIDNGTYDLSYNGPNGSQTVNDVSVTAGTYLLENLPGGSYDNIVFSAQSGCSSDPLDVTLNTQDAPILAILDPISPTTCPGDGVLRIQTQGIPTNFGYTITYDGGQFDNITILSSLPSVDINIPAIFSDTTFNNLQIEVNGCISDLGVSANIPAFVDTSIQVADNSPTSTCSPNSGNITLNIPNGDYSLLKYEFSNDSSFTNPTIIEQNISSNVINGQFVIDNLGVGFYRNFEFSASSGCSFVEASQDVVEIIEESNLPEITNVQIGNQITNCNIPDGTIEFTFQNTAINDTLYFTKDQVEEFRIITAIPYTLNQLDAGDYNNFRVEGLSSCSSSEIDNNQNLETPILPLIDLSVNQPLTCGAQGEFIFTLQENITSPVTYNLSFDLNGSPQPSQPLLFNSVGDQLTLAISSGNYQNIQLELNGCVSDFPDQTLNSSTLPTATVSSFNNPTTCSGNDGEIIVNISESGTYDLSFDGPNGSESRSAIDVSNGIYTIDNLVSGQYSNIVFTKDDCSTLSLSQSLTDPEAPEFTLNVTEPLNCSESGQFEFQLSSLTAITGDYQLSYVFDGSPVSQTLTFSSRFLTIPIPSPGIYENFSLERGGCSYTLPMNPPNIVLPLPVIQIVKTPIGCLSQPGKLAFNFQNVPDDTYTIEYDGGNFQNIQVVNDTASVEITSVGDYNNIKITVGSCTSEDGVSETFVEPTRPSVDNVTKIQDNLSCDLDNGQISFELTNVTIGDTLRYVYSEDNSSVQQPQFRIIDNVPFVLNNLQEGIYTQFLIIPLTNCPSLINIQTITIDSPVLPELSLGTTPPQNPSACNVSDGSIEFEINNIAVSESFDFSYQFEDENGTIVTLSSTEIFISNPFVLSNLQAGTYSNFIIQTTNGCSSTIITDEITLVSPSTPTVSLVSTSPNTVCNSSLTSTGEMVLQLSNVPTGINIDILYDGGTFASQFVETDSTVIISNIADATYSNIRLENNGCTSIGIEVTVQGPQLLDLTLEQNNITQPILCFEEGQVIFSSSDLPDGSYNFSYDGGVLASNIQINSGVFDAFDVPVGIYNAVFVTDNSTGCTTETIDFEIIAPVLSISTSSTSPSNCFTTDGVVQIQLTPAPIDGTYDFVYEDLDGIEQNISLAVLSGQAQIPGLTSGTYNNIRLQNSGCTSDLTSETISQPAQPVISVRRISNPTDCLSDDGSIVFEFGGQIPDGTYNLNYVDNQNVSQTLGVIVVSDSAVIGNLVQGTYSNISLETEFCGNTNVISSVILESPISSSGQIVASSNEVFIGETVSLSVTGVSSNSTFEWSNGSNESSIEVQPLENTAYSVQVTNPQFPDCSFVLTTTIVVNDWQLVLNTNEATICNQNSISGPLNIDLFVINSLPPEASVVWSNGGTGTSINVNEPGAYRATATLGNISKSASASVENTSVNISINNGCVSFIRDINGSHGPFLVSDDNITYVPQQSFSFTSGVDQVFIRDTIGCTYRFENDQENLSIQNFFSPDTDLFNSTWSPVGMEKCTRARVTIHDRYGRFVKSLAYNENWIGDFQDNSPVPADTYWYYIEFNDGITPPERGYVTVRRNNQ